MTTLLLPLIAACGQDDAGTDTADTASATPSATESPAADGAAAITGACKVLPASEVLEVLGASNGTTLQATEMEPQQGPSGTRYSCAYGQGSNRQALVLGVAEQTGAPAAGVDAAVKEAGATPTAVNGLGDRAVTYTIGEFRYVVAAVSHEQGHRLVFLGAPRVVPQEKLTELGDRVTQRI
jgi:hypothetical protein